MSEPLSIASVASLPPDEVVHEGGGQPERLSDHTFVGLDGEEVARPAPPSRSGRGRRAVKIEEAEAGAAAADGVDGTSDPSQRTAPERGRPGEKGGKPAAAPTTAKPDSAAEPKKDQAPQVQDSPEVQRAKRFDVTRQARPGETTDQTYQRLWEEETGRADRLALSAKSHGEELRAIRESTARMQEQLEALYREKWQEVQDRKREAEMAALPDLEVMKEQDPDAYRTLLAEEQYRQQAAFLEDQRRQQQTQQQQAQQQQQVQQHLEYLASRDEGIKNDIAQHVKTDPELDRAYRTSLWLTGRQIQAVYPQASEEVLEEMTYLAHMQELVDIKQKGGSIADYYRNQARFLREAAAQLQEQDQAAAGAGGNGRPVTPAPKAPAATGTTGSKTSAEVAKESARARDAAILSTGAPGRTGGIPGQAINPDDFASDDDYVAYMMKQAKGTSEKWLRETAGRTGATSSRPQRR